MELIDENVAMLSNYEVFSLLSKTKQKLKGKKPNGGSQNLATITYETMEYLSSTPCALQDPKIIKQFLEALKPYKLTKAEKLQLLNLRPTSPVEIQLMIAEIEERLSDEEISDLLHIISTVLPGASSEEESMETSNLADSDGACAASDVSDNITQHEQ